MIIVYRGEESIVQPRTTLMIKSDNGHDTKNNNKHSNNNKNNDNKSNNHHHPHHPHPSFQTQLSATLGLPGRAAQHGDHPGEEHLLRQCAVGAQHAGLGPRRTRKDPAVKASKTKGDKRKQIGS